MYVGRTPDRELGAHAVAMATWLQMLKAPPHATASEGTTRPRLTRPDPSNPNAAAISAGDTHAPPPAAISPFPHYRADPARRRPGERQGHNEDQNPRTGALESSRKGSRADCRWSKVRPSRRTWPAQASLPLHKTREEARVCCTDRLIADMSGEASILSAAHLW